MVSDLYDEWLVSGTDRERHINMSIFVHAYQKYDRLRKSHIIQSRHMPETIFVSCKIQYKKMNYYTAIC